VDETVCELDMEKAVIDVPAFAAGVLEHLVPAGVAVMPGQLIGRIT
jgi:pyruvate/2-oxoglutarate dehydrogenase complex dihydrolipoamide acyltransferase (E2) component